MSRDAQSGFDDSCGNDGCSGSGNSGATPHHISTIGQTLPYNQAGFTPLTAFPSSSTSAAASHSVIPHADPNHIMPTPTAIRALSQSFSNLNPLTPLQWNTNADMNMGTDTMMHNRSRSEPLAAPSEDVEMDLGPGIAAPTPRIASERPQSFHSQMTTNEPTTIQAITEESEPANDEIMPPRPPSPTATEIDDPESQDIIADILTRGVKVYDFAYTPSEQPPITLGLVPPTTSATSTIQTPAIPVTPATELFDQFRAIAEVEYRWSEPERTYPIPGSTSRRLLALGWITQEEFDARAHAMDREQLAAYDAHGNSAYPWKHFRGDGMAIGGPDGSTPPSMELRREMMLVRQGYFAQIDRMRMGWEMSLARGERLRKEGEEAMERMENNAREREAAMSRERAIDRGEGCSSWATGASGSKRAREGDHADDDDLSCNNSSPAEGKKRRISPMRKQPKQIQPSPFHPPAPQKQYPAPLHSYNPQLYPDAASIIGSRAPATVGGGLARGAMGMPAPSPAHPYAPTPSAGPSRRRLTRQDTPPLDSGPDGAGTENGNERSDTPPLGDDDNDNDREEGSSTRRRGGGTPLVHPRAQKALKRTLGRTETFSQL